MATQGWPQNRNSDGFLTGKLLIAMPGMADPRFEKTVIFMCSHSAEGAQCSLVWSEIFLIRVPASG